MCSSMCSLMTLHPEKKHPVVAQPSLVEKLVSSALGDQPEPVAMLLPIQQIEVVAGEVNGAAG